MPKKNLHEDEIQIWNSEAKRDVAHASAGIASLLTVMNEEISRFLQDTRVSFDKKESMIKFLYELLLKGDNITGIKENIAKLLAEFHEDIQDEL